MRTMLSLYPGDGPALVWLSAIVQVTAVTLLALVTSRTVARRWAAVRYGVGLCALGCALVSPLVAYVAHRAGFMLVMIPLMEMPTADIAANSDSEPLAMSAEPTATPEAAPESTIIEDTTAEWIAPAPPPPLDPGSPLADDASHALQPAEASSPPPPLTRAELIRAAIVVVLVLWAVGTLWCAARLFYGFGMLAVLRREAQPLGDVQPLGVEQHVGVLEQVRQALGIEALPQVVTSRLVGSPLSIGILRPLVVLPHDWSSRLQHGQLRDVLVHECAHVVQRDHVVGLLQRLAAALFWPHPLVHWLNRDLARAREEVCDNFVLRQSDRAAYARTLLALAEPGTLFHRAPATIGLMEPRWRLEDRVAGLLDERRKLTTRTSKGMLGLVGAAFASAMLLVGGMRLIRVSATPDDAPPLEATPVATEGQATDRPKAADSGGTDAQALDRSLVAKDDVHFEFVVPARVWSIPENRPRRATSVKLALRITNTTDRALRFSGFKTLALEIVAPDGKPLRPQSGSDIAFTIKETDCPLAKPGESVTFATDAELLWSKDKLGLTGVSVVVGDLWSFDDLKPGRYKLRLRYMNRDSEFKIGSEPVLKDVWTGEIATPLVEVSLAEPPAKTVDFGEEVAGLRAKVSLATDKFLIGEPLDVKYVVKNVSGAEQVLWHSGFWPNHEIVVRDADGKEAELTWMGEHYRDAFSPGGARDKNLPWRLPPGGEDATEGNYDLTKIYTLTKPGKYTVEYVYEERQGWAGRLPSNTLTFELEEVGTCPEVTIEKDGIHFSILVPDRSWQAPSRDMRAPVNIGLQISNKSTTAVRFSRFDTLVLEMTGPDGKALRQGGGRDGTGGRVASDAPLLKPGEHAIYVIDAALLWHGDELRLFGSDGFGGVRLLHDVKPGPYKVRVLYHDPRAELERSWPGQIATPFVEVSVVKPPERRAVDAGKADPRAKPATDKTNELASRDKELLQGTWKMVAAEVEGIRADADLLKKGRIEVDYIDPVDVTVKVTATHFLLREIVIEGDKISLQAGGEIKEGKLKLDPSRSPNAIDIITKGQQTTKIPDGTITGPIEIDITHQGIYKLEGDTLTICLYGAGRPSEFATKHGTHRELYRLAREKRGAAPGSAGQTDSKATPVKILDKKADEAKGDPTAERLKALKDDIASFELHLEYVTAENPPPFTSLLVHTDKARGTFRGNAHLVGVTILRDDSLKLVEELARDGFLRDASTPGKKLTGEIGFVLHLRAKKHSHYEILGRDDRRERLKTLRTVLDRDETVRALLLRMDGGKEGLLETLRTGLVGEPRPSGVDRLELTLASTKAEYRRGQPVDLSLTIKNQGTEEFLWAHYKLQDLSGFQMTGPDGKEVSRALNPVEIEFASTVITVKPGEATTVKEGLQGINLPKAGTDRYLRHGYYPMEAPGTYRLRIQVSDVVSNELTIKVLGKDEKEPEEGAVKDDLKNLDGTWRLVAVEQGGKAVDSENFGRNTHRVFSGTTSTFTSGKRRRVGKISIDATKTPKWIDESVGTPPLLVQGIYELKGGKLRLFMAPPGDMRPTEFKTKEGTEQAIQTYERVEAAR